MRGILQQNRLLGSEQTKPSLNTCFCMCVFVVCQVRAFKPSSANLVSMLAKKLHFSILASHFSKEPTSDSLF
jgi:hypothetical protein